MGREARDFSSSQAYSVGDLVLYGGVLYRFTSSHSAGDWTGNDVERVDPSVEQDLTRILAATDNAQKATAFTNTVVFDSSLIAGTRYKCVLTNAPDPRDG